MYNVRYSPHYQVGVRVDRRMWHPLVCLYGGLSHCYHHGKDESASQKWAYNAISSVILNWLKGCYSGT